MIAKSQPVPAPIPENEDERLTVLRHFNVLDSAQEAAFDNIVQLAATICETPMATVSLVDQDRQWFKAKVGLSVSETSRDVAFCAHAILQPDLLIVPDALKDPRFAANPLVLSDPNIRFYAGAPLEVAPDIRLGTLCVLDREPHDLLDSQAAALRILRDQIITLLRLREATTELEYREARYRGLFDGTTDIVFTHDLAGKLTSFNRAAEALTGYSSAEAQGMDLGRLIAAEEMDRMKGSWMTLAEIPARPQEVNLVGKDGRRFIVEVNRHLWLDPVTGEPVEIQGIARDVTERKRLDAALRASEERWRLRIENSFDYIAELDASGRTLWASWNHIGLGYTEGELIGRQLLEFVHPDDRESVATALTAMSAEKGATVVTRFRCKDGSIRWLEIGGRQFVGADGTAHLLTVAHDITARKDLDP